MMQVVHMYLYLYILPCDQREVICVNKYMWWRNERVIKIVALFYNTIIQNGVSGTSAYFCLL